jgi:hypothetical protein
LGLGVCSFRLFNQEKVVREGGEGKGIVGRERDIIPFEYNVFNY